MAEGCKEEQCCSKFNEHHLATIEDSQKKREENKSQWIVCGFNGFGQLKLENKRKLLQFEELQTPTNTNDADLLVACSWNCLAVANRCSLYLQGFTSNCPKTIKSIETQVPIKNLDICDKFCLFLTENGKVYKLLLQSENELKEIKFQTNLTPVVPQKRSIFGTKKGPNLQIAHVACGINITIAVSTTNSVFSGTTEIYQFPKHQNIKQLVCGFEHALLLTSNGDIYAWGNGLRGQLGQEGLRIEETPTLIEALAGIKISYIAAGGWHSAAISSFCDLYTWGFNSDGQLSLRIHKNTTEILKEPSVYPLPQLIDVTCKCSDNSDDLIDSCFPLKVAAGGRHTILQMNCGSINACGWNKYSQLGLTKSKQYCDNFELVLKLKDFKRSNDKKIICGNWCTLIEK